jgi:hypothetical protein
VARSKRSCSRKQDREINGLFDVLGTRTSSAALQTIENAAGSEIGPRKCFSCRQEDKEGVPQTLDLAQNEQGSLYNVVSNSQATHLAERKVRSLRSRLFAIGLQCPSRLDAYFRRVLAPEGATSAS